MSRMSRAAGDYFIDARRECYTRPPGGRGLARHVGWTVDREQRDAAGEAHQVPGQYHHEAAVEKPRMCGDNGAVDGECGRVADPAYHALLGFLRNQRETRDGDTQRHTQQGHRENSSGLFDARCSPLATDQGKNHADASLGSMIAPRRFILSLPAAVPFLLLLAAGVLLQQSPAVAEEAKKVSLELYYESLCPYCSRFMVNHLAGIFEDGLIDAVDLRLIPYGNAHVGSNGDIACQVKSKAHSTDSSLIDLVQDPLLLGPTESDVAGRFGPTTTTRGARGHPPRANLPINTPRGPGDLLIGIASKRPHPPEMAARLAVPALLLLLASSLLAAAAGDEGTEKVDVALYYESLCPYSALFVVNHLAKVFEDGLLDAVDLKLGPRRRRDLLPGEGLDWTPGGVSLRDFVGILVVVGSVSWCLLNTVEGCAIDAWPDLDVHFRFIYCVEDLVVKGQYKTWESCFQKLGLDPKPITECYQSEQGHKLDLKYANQTDALVPPHRYVPWVVVDGQPLLEDYENFEVYVCKAYKGSPPKVCEGLVQALETVVARSGVSYNSGGIELATAGDEGMESKIKMRLPDDDN
ncbi:hypothetical protein HU200_044756 [Digitaria exilis]|uniref:Gamma-interferon-inducible lysosomal thiol reductase n=1 Tax=Digitaria exilis TaxID=1010633 RepID=A0A835B1K5_9POAL|nr:hypothetical protein HU200_044756 [Digitaria exilis]